MKSLLMVAHGSRKQASNDEVRLLVKKIALSLPADIDAVEVAFLEFASPTIDVAVDAIFESGASELTVLPYFLASGKHVSVDLPEEVVAAMAKWPDKTVSVLPHIGAIDLMTDLVTAACQSTPASPL
jgi:sirohydrochlorin ferrochelatase